MKGAWDRLLREFPRSAIIMTVQDIDPTEQSCGIETCGVRVMRDPAGTAARAFNALWRPRVYALDPQGIVQYVQPDTVLDPQAPMEVERLWRRSSQ